jgi:hypothetical protein
MSKLFLPILFSLLSVSSFAQTEPTMWSRSNPPVDSSVVDSNVQNILIKLHESAHIAKNPHVTYDKSTLDPFSCYRSLINKTTGTEFWFKIDCSELDTDSKM